MSTWLLRLGVLAVALCSLGASCGQSALSVMPGVINDPANRSLRRAIFGFATGQLCEQVKKQSLPLKLRQADPSVGRFFPTGCAVQELANENLFVQFTGHGYAWTNVTKRIGFEASAAVEFNHDFLMDGSTMYVYFRQQKTQSTDFKVLLVEGQGQGGAAELATGLLGASLQQTTQQIGARLHDSQLARGFTVVRDSDGSAAFALGLLEKGKRPPAPFDKGKSDMLILANDRTEVHSGQRDYTGPYAIEDEGQALLLTVSLEGAPMVDVLVINKLNGESWILSYEKEVLPPPSPAPPMLDQTVQAAVPNPGMAPMLWRQAVPLPVGSYYVVFDNTASAGQSAPAAQTGDDRAALVSYGVQRGKAP